MGRVSAEKKRRPEFPSVEVPPVEPVLCASLFYQKQLQEFLLLSSERNDDRLAQTQTMNSMRFLHATRT